MHPWQMDTLADLNKQHHHELLQEAATIRSLRQRNSAEAAPGAPLDAKPGRSPHALMDALLALPARFRTA